MPSFKDYYEEYGEIPPCLTIGFSYLMALYASIEKQGDGYFVQVPNRTIELKDDLPYLEYFAGGGSVIEFMSNKEIWGEDLTAYVGFSEAVFGNVEKIKRGISLI